MDREADALERFAKPFTRALRDGSIEYYDQLVSGRATAPWKKNLGKELAKIDDAVKELFKAVLVLVLDDAGFEVLKVMNAPEDDATTVELNVNGVNLSEEPGDLENRYSVWVEQYSGYPEVYAFLEKYGTDGWPRILLKK